jgi:hypothetical protein
MGLGNAGIREERALTLRYIGTRGLQNSVRIVQSRTTIPRRTVLVSGLKARTMDRT